MFTKTFRIKCVNRDIDDFATNARKTKKNHNIMAKPLSDSFWIVWTVSRLSEQFLNYPDSFLVVQKVSGLSGQFLNCLDRFLIVRIIFKLSGQFLDCSERFWIVRKVASLV